MNDAMPRKVNPLLSDISINCGNSIECKYESSVR